MENPCRICILAGESRSAEDAVLCRGVGNAVWETVWRGPPKSPLEDGEPPYFYNKQQRICIMDLILKYFPDFLIGARNTIIYCVSAFPLALLFGLILALMNSSRILWL